MTDERKNEGRSLLSSFYYNRGFGERHTSLRTTKQKEELKADFAQKVTKAVDSGQITIQDLIDFLTDVKMSHERDHSFLSEPGIWD